MTQGDQLQDAASKASQDQGSQKEIDLDLVKVSIIGVNGEWLDEMPSLGENVTLQVSGYVRRVGQEALEGDTGAVRDFVQIKATGVKRTK